MSVTLSRAVKSITWTWNRHKQTFVLQEPSQHVTLPVPLTQGKRFSITLNQAIGDDDSQLLHPVTIKGSTPPALTVVTNPGPWQLSVPRNGPFTLTFSVPIRNPEEVERAISFDPPVSGHLTWPTPNIAEFIPDAPLAPTQTEVMKIQGGASGPRGTQGQYLSSASIVRPFITHSDLKIIVHEKLPQTLYLYKSGHLILKSLCNTGVTGATTPTGEFYIRSMVPDTEMKGTNPDGTTYDDPHVPWVMGLFGNTAIHGFKRDKYGFPQSNQCVELPIAVAKKLFQLVHVGAPVVIQQ